MRYLALSAILFALLSTSCTTEGKSPFEVTYEVNALTDAPLALMISYRDSKGRQTVYTKDKHWMKRVSMRPDQLASLLVTATCDLSGTDSLPVFCPGRFCHRGGKETRLVSGKIIHPRKIVRESDERLVLISMFQPEAKGFRGLPFP